MKTITAFIESRPNAATRLLQRPARTSPQPQATAGESPAACTSTLHPLRRHLLQQQARSASNPAFPADFRTIPKAPRRRVREFSSLAPPSLENSPGGEASQGTKEQRHDAKNSGAQGRRKDGEQLRTQFARNTAALRIAGQRDRLLSREHGNAFPEKDNRHEREQAQEERLERPARLRLCRVQVVGGQLRCPFIRGLSVPCGRNDIFRTRRPRMQMRMHPRRQPVRTGLTRHKARR